MSIVVNLQCVLLQNTLGEERNSDWDHSSSDYKTVGLLTLTLRSFQNCIPGEGGGSFYFWMPALRQINLHCWSCCAYRIYKYCTVLEVGTQNKATAVYTLGEKGSTVFILCNHWSILGEHFEMFPLVVLSAAPQTYLFSKHRWCFLPGTFIL